MSIHDEYPCSQRGGFQPVGPTSPGVLGRPCLSSASASTTILRMIAARATFGGLPLRRNAVYFQPRSGLWRSASTVAIKAEIFPFGSSSIPLSEKVLVVIAEEFRARGARVWAADGQRAPGAPAGESGDGLCGTQKPVPRKIVTEILPTAKPPNRRQCCPPHGFLPASRRCGGLSGAVSPPPAFGTPSEASWGAGS